MDDSPTNILYTRTRRIQWRHRIGTRILSAPPPANDAAPLKSGRGDLGHRIYDRVRPDTPPVIASNDMDPYRW